VLTAWTDAWDGNPAARARNPVVFGGAVAA
jgi:hypothetical protein